MKLEPLNGIDGTEVSYTKAQEVLTSAKELHATKCCELRIDERTIIMVTPENCTREYAQAYCDRMNKMQLTK